MSCTRWRLHPDHGSWGEDWWNCPPEGEPELMLAMADRLCPTVDEVVVGLAKPSSTAGHRNTREAQEVCQVLDGARGLSAAEG